MWKTLHWIVLIIFLTLLIYLLVRFRKPILYKHVKINSYVNSSFLLFEFLYMFEFTEWDSKEEGKEVTQQWEDDWDDDDVNDDFSLQLRRELESNAAEKKWVDSITSWLLLLPYMPILLSTSSILGSFSKYLKKHLIYKS